MLTSTVLRGAARFALLSAGLSAALPALHPHGSPTTSRGKPLSWQRSARCAAAFGNFAPVPGGQVKPPVCTERPSGTAPSLYDVIGRHIFDQLKI